MATITGIDIQAMVRHWLNTPMGAYLGSDYGSNIPDLLQLPFSDGLADAVIQKMRADIPILQSLPGGSINIYSITTAPDRRELLIEFFGQTINFSGRTSPGRPPSVIIPPPPPLFAPPSGYTSSVSSGITTWVAPACINSGIAEYGGATWSSAIGGGVDMTMRTPSIRGVAHTQAYSTGPQVFASFIGGINLTAMEILGNQDVIDWLALQGITSVITGDDYHFEKDIGQHLFTSLSQWHPGVIIGPLSAHDSCVAHVAEWNKEYKAAGDDRDIVLFDVGIDLSTNSANCDIEVGGSPYHSSIDLYGGVPGPTPITNEQAAEYMSQIPTPAPTLNAILGSGACIPVTYFELILDGGMENENTQVVTS